MPSEPSSSFDPRTITRPDPLLMKYYVLVSCVSTVCIVPLTLLVLIPLAFRYSTLRYRFDDEGIWMSWGVLFKREINLTYRRIQDIHVTRNLFQRWMGLASVAVQTASGSATPEMTIEGIRDPDALRDFLYTKMRGARGEQESPAVSESESATLDHDAQEALELLREIRAELAGLRRELAAHRPSAGSRP